MENLGVNVEENNCAEAGNETASLLLNTPEVHALRSTHCKKEDCTICKTLDNVTENQENVVLQVPIKDCRELEEESNISLGICRICHCNSETLPELGHLESVCRCRGTVALVHMYCLERWLAESETSSCELCGFQYDVQRIPKHGIIESMYIWANEVADPNQVSKDFVCFLTTVPLALILAAVALNTMFQLVSTCFCNTPSAVRSRACSGIAHFILCLGKVFHYNMKFKLVMDTLWFWLMTPLAAMAGYIFIRAASELIDETFPTDAPWLMAALLVNSCLTLLAYYGWVVTCVKQHVCSWYRWWRTMDCIVKIQLPADKDNVPPPPPVETEIESSQPMELPPS